MTVVDPHDMRDWMTRQRLRSYERAGVAVSADAVERQVVADCELVDAARRAGELNGAPSSSGPVEQRERSDELVKAQQDTGTRLSYGDGKYERFNLLHANPMTVSPKWAHACARIKRILETVNTSTSDLVKAVESAELSALAKEVAEVMAWWFYNRRSQSPHNPFRGLKTLDALRKYERLIYDICDRSTGKLGHWWVK